MMVLLHGVRRKLLLLATINGMMIRCLLFVNLRSLRQNKDRKGIRGKWRLMYLPGK